MDYLDNILLTKILSELDFRYVYSIRLTCKRFLNISKKIHLRLNDDIFDIVLLRGTTEQYFSELLSDKKVGTIIYEKFYIKRLCNLKRCDLLEIYLQKRNIKPFVLDNMSYIRDLECF